MTRLRKPLGPDRHPALEVLVLKADGSLDGAKRDEVESHVASCVACGLMSDLIGPLQPNEADAYIWDAFSDSTGETADWAGPSRPRLPIAPFVTAPADLPRLPGTVIPLPIGLAARPPMPGLRLAADDGSEVVASFEEGTDTVAVRMTRESATLQAEAEGELAGRGWELFIYSRDLEDVDPDPRAAGVVPQDGIITVPVRVLDDERRYGLQLVWRFGEAANGATDA